MDIHLLQRAAIAAFLSAFFFSIGPCLAQAGRPHADSQADCEAVPTSPNDELVIAGVHEGDTLANVLLGSGDLVSTIVRVTIEPGEKAIVLFVSGSSTVIWDFRGDTTRLRRVVATSPSWGTTVGVRGLDSSRVSFVEPPCGLIVTGTASGAALQSLQDRAARLVGRRADHIVYEYEAGELKLPGATFNKTDRTSDGLRRRATRAEVDLYDFHPGGFRELEPGSILSPARVWVPETPPGEAGLIQLERVGAIRQPRQEEVDAWNEAMSAPFRSRLSPSYRLETSFDYVVARDIMLPVGLGGAHSKHFLVTPGVTRPRGSPGHSCIAMMDGTQVSDLRLCLDDAAGAIEQLAKMPAMDDLAACQLVTVPEDAQLEAVSVYEPEDASRGPGTTRRDPAPIDVLVTKPGAIFLVLSSPQPVIWRPVAATASRIAGVLLISDRRSHVEGLAPDIPVHEMHQEVLRQRHNPDLCQSVTGHLATAYQGGPYALVLDRQVQALTGRPLDGLRGAYTLREVEVR